jgi:hypothetical protein
MANCDLFLLHLEAEQITWWEYSRQVPLNLRPKEYIDYWTYLKNRNNSNKRFIKEAEWRMEARRKGLLKE